MSQTPRGINAAIVELGDRVRIGNGRKRQRWLYEPIFELGDEVCLPLQPLYLPGPQCECGDGYESYIK